MQMLVWTSSAIPPRENAPSSSSSLLRSYTLFSCSLARISPPLLPLRILLLFHLSFLHLLFSSSPPLFFLFFFFFAVAVVATPVSGSPQPAIAAALVLRVVIRMFVRELVSLSTSSSRRLLRRPFSARFFASSSFSSSCGRLLVAVRTVRSSSIARLAKTELFAERMPFCGLFAVALASRRRHRFGG